MYKRTNHHSQHKYNSCAFCWICIIFPSFLHTFLQTKLTKPHSYKYLNFYKSEVLIYNYFRLSKTNELHKGSAFITMRVSRADLLILSSEGHIASFRASSVRLLNFLSSSDPLASNPNTATMINTLKNRLNNSPIASMLIGFGDIINPHRFRLCPLR